MKKSDLPVKVEFSPYFAKALKQLRKKYAGVVQDVLALGHQLERGDTPGDQIKGTKYTVYKVRVKSSDLQKGKSGGFRVIYYLKTVELVVLITIYSKSSKEDISHELLRRLIEEYEKSV